MSEEPKVADVLSALECYYSKDTGSTDTSRIRRFVASTGTRDRCGDEIPPSAWDVKNYMRNPVVLYGHSYGSLPIGRATKVEVTDKALVVDVQFTTPEENIVGDQVMRLYDGGFLSAVSVGFRSKASEWIDRNDEEEAKRAKKEPDTPTGRRFTKVELLEVSCVPVPANPDARMQATKKGLVWPEPSASTTASTVATVTTVIKNDTVAVGVPGDVQVSTTSDQPSADPVVEACPGREKSAEPDNSARVPEPSAGEPQTVDPRIAELEAKLQKIEEAIQWLT